MAKKRDRLEVIFDILDIVRSKNNSIKPTPLLRFSNLSTNSFKEYYSDLLKKDLLREVLDEKNRKYITLTDKGFRYLEKYKGIVSFIDEFDL